MEALLTGLSILCAIVLGFAWAFKWHEIAEKADWIGEHLLYIVVFLAIVESSTETNEPINWPAFTLTADGKLSSPPLPPLQPVPSYWDEFGAIPAHAMLDALRDLFISVIVSGLLLAAIYVYKFMKPKPPP